MRKKVLRRKEKREIKKNKRKLAIPKEFGTCFNCKELGTYLNCKVSVERLVEFVRCIGEWDPGMAIFYPKGLCK